MPDFCVQVGTSLPRNKTNRPARPRGEKGKGGQNGAAAAALSPAAGALTAAPGAHHAGSQAGDPSGSAPKNLHPPIAGSREQRKKARAARFPRVVVADTVTDYRRVIPLLVDPSDIVLEVGCCSGATTNVLFDHCARAVGVDLSDTELTKARARYPHIEFHRIDAFDIAALKALREKHRFNKIFLDINGSRDVSAITKLISIYADGWEDSNATGAINTIVVKNWRMANLLRSTQMTAELLGSAQYRSFGHCAATETGSTESAALQIRAATTAQHESRKTPTGAGMAAMRQAASSAGDATPTSLIAVAGVLLGLALGCVVGRKFR